VADPVYRFGRFELRAASRALLEHGHPVELGARAFDVLLALVERRERVVTKDELLDVVWPGLVVEENNLQVQVSAVRKVLGAGAIATIPGRGYQFTAQTADVSTHPSRQPQHGLKALPRPVTCFIGRQAELAEYAQRIMQTRLLTLTALGGSGKTRLAIELARGAAEQFPGGAWFVDLAPITAPERVALAVMSALDVREDAQRSAIDSIVSRVDGEPLLLVLDNCEHLLDAVGTLVEAVLSRTASVSVLATSRERLGIAGEQAVVVPPLSVAAADGTHAGSEAAQLFLDRARLTAPDLALDARTLEDIDDICRRLEGMPLAIELAAARTSVLSSAEIRQRLADRLRLLTGSRRGNPRQQTLRDVIAWSYEQLAPHEQRALRRLSVFAGWTLQAAHAVTMPSSDDVEAIDVLARLVDLSLIVVDRTGEGPSRYRMLELVRAFAQEELQAAGEADDAGERHLRHCVDLAERHGSSHVDRHDATAFAGLDRELDNLAAAHDWCDSHPGSAELGLRLVAALRDFLVDRAHLRIGRAMIERALIRDQAPQRGRTRAAGLAAAACLAGEMGDHTACGRYAREAVELARDAQDIELEVFALMMLSSSAQETGGYSEAWRHMSEVLARAREHGLNYYVMAALVNLGEIARLEDRLDDAARLYEQALAVDHTNEFGRRTVHFNLSIVANERGDYAAACHHLRETSREARLQHSPYLEWCVLQHAAALAAATGDAPFAARLWGALDAAAQATGLALQRADRPFLLPRIDQARTALGETAFAAAFAEGQALAPRAALAQFDAWLDRYLAVGDNAAEKPGRVTP
jgi:non-specific serine/threonine protein kinase